MKRHAVLKSSALPKSERQYREKIARALMYGSALSEALNKLLSQGRLQSNSPQVAILKAQVNTLEFLLTEIFRVPEEMSRKIMEGLPKEKKSKMVDEMMRDICPLIITVSSQLKNREVKPLIIVP